jgi:hypothetical protein
VSRVSYKKILSMGWSSCRKEVISMVPSILVLGEVKDQPSVHKDLPAMLPIGERVKLHFFLRRKNGSRTEELHVDGDYRVTSSFVDATLHPPRQVLSVEALGVAPAWKAVRNPPAGHQRRFSNPTHTKVVVTE